MKRIIFYTLMVSIICLAYACSEKNVPEKEDVITVEPPFEKEDPQPEDPQPGEPPGNMLSAEPIDLTLKQGEKATVDNRFALKMFKAVSKESKDPTNTFFSPLSLNLALGMLYNGASGETRTEMAEVLVLADFTPAEINEYYQKMSQALLEIDELTDISIANSIWYREGFPVKPSFIDINQTYFDAMVQSLDFNKPDATNIINSWCADKTRDKIKDIIANPIPPDIMMYLMNALYFNSNWVSKFNKANTKQADFTKADNSKIKVNLMEQTTFFPYYADPYVQCVEMPYGNNAFSMVVMLGVDNMSIDQLIDYLDDATWQKIVSSLYWRNVQIKLPRFKIECEIELNEPVKNAGMKRIFGGGFANISDVPVAVSYIKQKTFVDVNEEGTEAAAVTAIAVATSVPPPPVQFFANRPFLYLIKEKSTGVILFIGRMDEPQE